MIVAINATAYDDRPSGARTRAVGLAAALLRAGHYVRMYARGTTELRADVAYEHGGRFPEDRFEHFTPSFLDRASWKRPFVARKWFDTRLTRDNDLFVTDYYPVLTRIPTLLTVHDLRYYAAPRHESARRVVAFRALFPRYARRALSLLAPTAAVAAEAGEHLGREAVVAGNGLPRAWRAAKPAGEDRDHLLMIGFAERRKDLATALAAMRRAPTAPPLVVAGRGRPPRAARALIDAGRVRFVGEVDDEDLVTLARGAAALVHPSRYEGFGLPVIEAISVGVPVLVAAQPAVEEVAGGFATVLPPGDADAWAAAMTSIPQIPVGARDHARSFTWDAMAARTLEAAGVVPSSS